jgi:hypothetical protein
MAFEFVIRAAIGHGVVEGQLLAGLYVSHGNQSDLPEETQVGLARMIKAIVWFRLLGGQQIQILIKLKDALSKTRHGRIKFVFADDAPAPQGDKLIFGDDGHGKDTTPARGMFTVFTLGIQIGAGSIVHGQELYKGNKNWRQEKSHRQFLAR